MSLERFHLAIEDTELEHLRARLARVRWPDEPPDEPWRYGTSLAFMREVVEYWRTTYDWRKTESELNTWPQFVTTIDGIDVHFLWVKGRSRQPRPLLLSHGWPGSVLEFMKLIPLLADPVSHGGSAVDAFTLVIPSLPNHTLSFKRHQPRCSVEQMAAIFHKLMARLGYERYGAQGGDKGAFITAWLGAHRASHLVGIHLNFLPLPRHAGMFANPSVDELRYLLELERFLKEETGYQWIQGTRPQTLAFGLSDSPAGLAAWILEKYRAWSDCDGDLLSAFTMDEVLGNVSLYWFTNSIGASFWSYYARMHGPWPIDREVAVPTAYCAFPCEVLRPPREAAERMFDIRRWTVMEKGGHFAALEQPVMLARDIREFFRPLM